jgi:hypothetical protein
MADLLRPWRTLTVAKIPVQQAAVKLAPLWEREAGQQRAYNKQIAAVAQPSADRARLAQLAGAREGLAITDESIAAMLRTSPDVAAYERCGKELARQGTRLSALDRAYGFKACGGGSG